MPAGCEFTHDTKPDHTVFVYVIGGSGRFDEGADAAAAADNGTLLLFGDGTGIKVAADEKGVRFLLIAGKPLGEPVAWQGPIVMNTQAELQLAFEEYRQGTFIKA